MYKKIILVAALILLLALALPAAFAAISPDKKAEIDALHQQILELRKQIIDKYVESGEITPQQGNFLKERLELMEQFRQDNNLGPWYCWGPGGMMGGWGPGGMMGGWGPGFLRGPENKGASFGPYGLGMMRGL